jgi:hypothetical protein
MVPDLLKGGECLVLGDSIVGNVGTDCSDMKFGCFPGIRKEQLPRVTENRDLGNPDAVVIRFGTNELRRTGNLDYVMGDVYDLVNMAKNNVSKSRVVLSAVFRRRDVSWRGNVAVNSRYEWVSNALWVAFVDPNIWVDDWDFGSDGFQINRKRSETPRSTLLQSLWYWRRKTEEEE